VQQLAVRVSIPQKASRTRHFEPSEKYWRQNMLKRQDFLLGSKWQDGDIDLEPGFIPARNSPRMGVWAGGDKPRLYDCYSYRHRRLLSAIEVTEKI
jgi:hypothetical protein